jgi:cardiolipin synthase
MMLRIDDPAFAAAMRGFIDREIEDSRRIMPAEHRKSMTLLNRLRWAFGYFMMVTADYNLARRLNLGTRKRLH